MVKDRIVEIGIVKKMVNGETLRKRLLINPGMPIPKESTEIHGITNEMVERAPLFEEKAKEILQLSVIVILRDSIQINLTSPF